MKTWQAPLAVVAIVVVIAGAFAVGGPQAGLPLGAVVGAIIIIFAIRQKPDEQISPPGASDTAAHILIVLARPVDDAAATEKVATAISEAEGDGPEWPDRTEVLVLAPAATNFLDRWATDFSRARADAQRSLVVTVAALAKAEVGAEARVGDADLVQAAEDQLRSFPATQVILVTGPADGDPRGNRAAAELQRRLSVPMNHVITG